MFKFRLNTPKGDEFELSCHNAGVQLSGSHQTLATNNLALLELALKMDLKREEEHRDG